MLSMLHPTWLSDSKCGVATGSVGLFRSFLHWARPFLGPHFHLKGFKHCQAHNFCPLTLNTEMTRSVSSHPVEVGNNLVFYSVVPLTPRPPQHAMMAQVAQFRALFRKLHKEHKDSQSALGIRVQFFSFFWCNKVTCKLFWNTPSQESGFGVGNWIASLALRWDHPIFWGLVCLQSRYFHWPAGTKWKIWGANVEMVTICLLRFAPVSIYKDTDCSIWKNMRLVRV